MIKVNFKDGRTESYDLKKTKDTSVLHDILKNGGCPDVTAISILDERRKILHTFPKPEVSVYEVGAELLVNKKKGKVSAEVVWYDVGEMIIKYMVYVSDTKVTKLEVLKKGD